MTTHPSEPVEPIPQPEREAAHVCHTHYCRVVSPVTVHAFRYLARNYELRFEDEDFTRGQGFVVAERDAAPLSSIAPELLTWLLVFFGEDTLNPYQEIDTISIWERGDFPFDPSTFDTFISACERVPTTPRWRARLFDQAITYLSMAVRSGMPLMPLNLGLFGLCLECLGNVFHARRDQYFKLGDKRFMGLLNTRLARYKRSDGAREGARKFQKHIADDVDLLHAFRNAFYGHSLLHLDKDRRALIGLLRKWYSREFGSKQVAARLFRPSTLDDSLTNEFPALYKVGLRLCRTFIWMTLGFSRPPPFATRDFSIAGDLRVGERLRGPAHKSSTRLARG